MKNWKNSFSQRKIVLLLFVIDFEGVRVVINPSWRGVERFLIE